MQHTVHRVGAVPRITYHRAIAMPAALPKMRGQTTRVGQGVWRRAAFAFMSRPLLVLTVAIAGVFLFSAASEALAAQRLTIQVNDARQTNAALQLQLTRTAEQIRDHTNPAAITAAAQKLGWVQGTSMP